MRHEDKDMVNDFLEAVRPNKPTTVEIVKNLCEGTKAEKINVTFSEKLQEPIRAESPARAHRFNSLSGYAEYLERNAQESVTVLADAATGDMAAVLDEESSDGYEIITFTPRVNPLFAPWVNTFGKAMPIKKLATFLITNRRVIAHPDVDHLVRLFKQIQISKNVTLMEGTGGEAINGVICHTKLQGKDGDQKAPLPEQIALFCPLFVDTPPLEIEVDLLLEATADDQPTATFVSADADVKRLLAIQRMLEELKAKLPGATVSLGQLKYNDWKYLGDD